MKSGPSQTEGTSRTKYVRIGLAQNLAQSYKKAFIPWGNYPLPLALSKIVRTIIMCLRPMPSTKIRTGFCRSDAGLDSSSHYQALLDLHPSGSLQASCLTIQSCVGD